jgi:hypothetical protein
MPEPEPQFGRPPGGPPPPAPPATGAPHGVDPSDPGPPILVTLGRQVVGDLGHPRVDARLLQAILLRDGHVARWLRAQGVDAAAVERGFPGCGWPPGPF